MVLFSYACKVSFSLLLGSNRGFVISMASSSSHKQSSLMLTSAKNEILDLTANLSGLANGNEGFY